MSKRNECANESDSETFDYQTFLNAYSDHKNTKVEIN